MKYSKNNKYLSDGNLELWNTQMNNISLESKNIEELRDEEEDSNYMKFNSMFNQSSTPNNQNPAPNQQKAEVPFKYI